MEKTQEELVKERTEQLKRTTKRTLIVFAAIIVLIIIYSVLNPSSKNGNESAVYEVVSTQAYTRDGQQCMGYRVYVQTPGSLSYSQIAEMVVSGDEYAHHTVWFYHSKSDATGTDAAFQTIED